MKIRDRTAGCFQRASLALLLGAAIVRAQSAPDTSATPHDCVVPIGLVMELTGPAGIYGQAAAKAIEMSVRDLNDAGDLGGCRLVTVTKDSQSQATVAVDAANQLVQLNKVPVLIGGIISSVTIPILTSVTGPAHVLQVSPAASSPRLTRLAQAGESGGLFLRTITSDALQGAVAAQYAIEHGLRRLAVIYVHDDFGVSLYREFAADYRALGGVVVAATPYDERQSSYSSEVTSVLAAASDGLYLIATPVDGATIARSWISLGGARRFLLNDGMNSADFIASVGAKYLNDAYGTSSGTSRSASSAYFDDHFKAFSQLDPASPAADRAYDAGALVGLAIAAASDSNAVPANQVTAAQIRAAIGRVTDPRGAVIHAGRAEFGRALGLLKAGKSLRYEGVIGAISFDAAGDITGPFRLWRLSSGRVTTVGEMDVNQVEALMTKFHPRKPAA